MTTLLFLLLTTKHFVIDFLLQTPYQYLNKGKYGHLGGILHASLHGLATLLIMLLVMPSMALLLAGIDAIVHYHIDWAKVKVNTHYGLTPDNSEKYWWLLGFDQFLHYVTYVGLVSMVV